MAKKKKELSPEEKHLKEMDKCKPFYEALKDELQLDGDEINQIHQLVEEGIKLNHIISEEIDKIRIEGFDKASRLLTIDKATWNEFVNITAKKMYGNLSEKSVEKMNEKIVSKQYINNLQQAFYDSYLADETLKKVDESGVSDVIYDKEEDNDLAKLIEEYAKVRDYINKTLNVRMKQLGKAAFFITDGKLEVKDFKNLVDWEYSKDSENPENPSSSWKIYEKFARMYRILYNFGFDQIVDLDHEFGYSIEVGTPHPQTHSWQIDESSLD